MDWVASASDLRAALAAADEAGYAAHVRLAALHFDLIEELLRLQYLICVLSCRRRRAHPVGCSFAAAAASISHRARESFGRTICDGRTVGS